MTDHISDAATPHAPGDKISAPAREIDGLDPSFPIIAAWKTAIAESGEALLRHALVDVPGDSPDWVDSSLDIHAGETVTLLAAGALGVPGAPEASFTAGLFLWFRIGARGAIAKFPAATETFKANESGRLFFAAHYPGAWVDETGGFAADWPRDAASGALNVAILVWNGPAAEALALFAAKDKSGVAAEARARFLEPIRPPRGWAALWRTGATEIFREPFAATDAPVILCRCGGDAGIIKYPVDIPLDATTRLFWSWRVIALPSQVAEDSAPTHDYLSIAVEFDNGLDLTYIWSAALPVGAVFRCPLPWWNRRETHQVVRSGEADLGRWRDEEQPVLADYAKAIGGAPPERIVGVWLIAVAAFQKRRGECEYRRIELAGSGARAAIGP